MIVWEIHQPLPISVSEKKAADKLLLTADAIGDLDRSYWIDHSVLISWVVEIQWVVLNNVLFIYSIDTKKINISYGLFLKKKIQSWNTCSA